MADDAFAPCPEIWKPIPGHEGYEASTLGRIRSLPGGRRHPGVMTPSSTRGYAAVTLGRRCQKRVQRLILETFVRPGLPGEHGAHLDGNPQNNRLDNLAWKSPKENIADQKRHGTMPFGSDRPNAKLTDDDVRSIRRLRAQGLSWREIYRQFPRIYWTNVIKAGVGDTYCHITDVPPVRAGHSLRGRRPAGAP